MADISKPVLERPVADYLTGYQLGTKWVEGLLPQVAALRQMDSWYIRAILFFAVMHFFGISTLEDVLRHLPAGS